jgi:predicted PilT family ATPase
MKKSELKEYIKEMIVSELTEADSTPSEKAANTAEINAEKLKIKASQERIVNLQKGVTESEDEDTTPDEDTLDKQASAAANKKDSITTASSKLQKLVAKMKGLAKEYKSAEGDKKEKIKDELKKLTVEKKALEKAILPPSEEED